MIIPHKAFYFIRHGETDWNKRHLYMGSQDIPLNKNGIRQAEIAAKLLMKEKIAHIVTSPLLRAHKTAEIIAKTINKPITIIDALKERHLGKKEGQAVDNAVPVERWLVEDSHFEEEISGNFEQRVIHALNIILNESPEPVLIVAHGGVYCAMCKVLGWPFIELKNCVALYHQPPKELTHPWFISNVEW